MKKKQLRLIGLLLAAILALSACGNAGDEVNQGAATDTGTTTTDSSADTATDTTTDTTTDATAADPDRELITVTLAAPMRPIDDRFDILDDPVSLLIKEKFNIQIEAINAGDDSDWGTRLSGLIAANDIPDIVFIPDEAQVAMMVSAGQLLNLESYLTAEYLPRSVADNKFMASSILHRNLSGTGELYTFGMNKGTWDSGSGILVGDYIRWDLYKDMGYPAINSYDDLLDVLLAMQEAYPTNDHGQSVYGMGGWFGEDMGWGDWAFTYGMSFSLGRTLSADNTMGFDIATRQPAANPLKDKDGTYWQTVRFYNKAYQMGVLDPESFIQNTASFEEKVYAERYLYVIPRWYADHATTTAYPIDNGNPEKGFVQLPDVSGTGMQSMIDDSVRGERIYGVSASTAHPERVLELLDWMLSYEFSMISTNGVENVYWEMVDGKPFPKPGLYDRNIQDTERKAASGAGIYNWARGYADGTFDPQYDQALYLGYLPVAQEIGLTAVQKDFLEHVGAASLSDAYIRPLDYYENNILYDGAAISDDLASDLANMKNHIFGNIFRIIMAESDEEFTALQDQLISDLDRFNVDAIHEYFMEDYLEIAGQYNEIYRLLNE